jgi:hypothetical protein
MWVELNPTIPLWIEPEHIVYGSHLYGVNTEPTIEFNYNQLSIRS